MAKDVIMPVLGMNQDFGTVVRWLVDEGEAVVEGEPLLEVETDKAVVEVPAMGSGVLANVTAAEGDEVPTGTVIAVLLEEGERGAAPAPRRASATPPLPASPETTGTPEARAGAAAPPAAGVPAAAGEPNPLAARSAPATAAPPPTPPANGAARTQAAAMAAPAPTFDETGRVLATPKARRLAGELSLDLRAVPGSGPGGAVRAVDIVALVARRAAAPTATPGETVWIRRSVDLSGLADAVTRANAHLARLGQPVGIAGCDVLAKVALVALASLGAPQGSLGLARGDGTGAVESVVLTGQALGSLLTMAAARAAGGAAGAATVHVLDLSDMPYESSLPPLPVGCRLRLALTSAPGDADRRGALTLEHTSDPGVDPAQLLARLASLVEDPASALLYA